MSTWQEALVDAAREGDALRFASEVLGFLRCGEPNPEGRPQLEKWQEEALQRFSRLWANRLKKPPRLAIKSGHGVGKTCLLTILVLFVLLTNPHDTKIPVVANSQDQLRDGLWPELSKWINTLPEELREHVKWEAERVFISQNPQGAFAVRRTASTHRPEALQGMHAETILVVLEEASGLPEETIQAGAGTLSTPGAAVIAVGNPTRASGFFWRTFNSPQVAAQWERMSVNSEDVPRARGHVDDIIALYGKESNAYRVRVLGEFPSQDDDTVIPLALVKAAIGRDVKKSWVWPIWGVDVGRHGDDASALVKRQGNTIIALPKMWRNMDGNQVAGRIIHEYENTPTDEKPKRINVDVIGVGYSVFDRLRDSGSPVKNIVSGINVAEETTASDLDRRLRDELWFFGRKWFEGKDVCIPKDLVRTEADQQMLDRFISEMTSVTFDFDMNGKRVVERKADMKKRLGHSPDIADAFLLTFLGGSHPRERMSDGRPQEWEEASLEMDISEAWAA